MQDLNATIQPQDPSLRPGGKRDTHPQAQAEKHRGLRRTLPQAIDRGSSELSPAGSQAHQGTVGRGGVPAGPGPGSSPSSLRTTERACSVP